MQSTLARLRWMSHVTSEMLPSFGRGRSGRRRGLLCLFGLLGLLCPGLLPPKLILGSLYQMHNRPAGGTDVGTAPALLALHEVELHGLQEVLGLTEDTQITWVQSIRTGLNALAASDTGVGLPL